MKLFLPIPFFVIPLLLLSRLQAGVETPAANINSRYRIEHVELVGAVMKKMTTPLRSEIDGLVGKNFDPQLVSDFASKIKAQVHRRVSQKIERGTEPDSVRLVFTAEGPRLDEDIAKVTKLKYHHKQGWTGGLGVGYDIKNTRLELGVQSDADELLERFTGFNAAASHQVGDRVGLRLDFGASHQEWNQATLQELQGRAEMPGAYRERFSIEPSLIIALAEHLTLTVGTSLQQLQTQFPAARFEAANALETTLRYKARWRESDTLGQELDTGYNLRAATNFLGSDYTYTRHLAHLNYAVRYEGSLWTVRFQTGHLSGEAPLFERFTAGNTTSLRGWNKFDISPVGGNRIATGSVGYRYKAIGLFYDTGSVWEEGKEPEERHSLGATLALGALDDGFSLTLAFPLRSGAIQPLFMLGMNF